MEIKQPTLLVVDKGENNMAKLKRLSTDIIASLVLEPLTFNQLQREMSEPLESRETLEDVLDMLIQGGLLVQVDNLYKVTDKAKDYFSCWEY